MEHERSGTISLRDFYLRRALRIWPPFYTVLLLAFALGALGALGVVPGKPQLGPALAQVFHFTNYWQILHGTAGLPEGTGVYWSLACEEHFYLVFPCLFLLLQRVLKGQRAAQANVLLAICGLVLAWRCFLVFSLHASSDRTYLGSDTRVDSILWGCALAIGGNPMLDEPRIPSSWMRRVLLPIGVLLLGVGFLYRAPWFRETLRYTIQGIAMMPIFIVAIREPDFLPMRLLNWKPLRHVGVLSYSLYLSHHVVLYAVPERLGVWPHALLALLISFVVAEIIHRYIEKPCARLRHRLSHSGNAQAAKTAA